MTDRDVAVNSANVIHVDHSVSPGGAEFALKRILLAARDDRVLILPSTDSLGVFEEVKAVAGIRIVRGGPKQKVGASKNRWNPTAIASLAVQAFGQAVFLRTHATFRNSSVVHANTSRSAVYAALACIGSRKKLVVHLRDMSDADALGGIGFVLFTRLALKRADAVIANSRATLQSASPYLASNSITTVIPSPAGISGPAKPYSPNDQFTVGMVARLAPWKGQHLLVQAFALAFRGSDARLRLIGGAFFDAEDYQEEVARLAQSLGIADQVEFVGHVSDVSREIATLDVCVQASTRAEPLGQNVLQYLGAGRPTVVVDRGGPAEWVTDQVNGLTFHMGDADDLARALTLLESDVGLRERLAEAAARTPGLLSDQEVADVHTRFLERVAELPKRWSPR